MIQGERIKIIRKALNLTLEKFGEKVGVTKVAISNIEKGNRKLTDQMAKSICREFNVNEEWLREGIGEPFIELDREDELFQWVHRVLKNKPNNFKKRLLKVLMSLDEKEWEYIEQKAKDLVNNPDDLFCGIRTEKELIAQYPPVNK